MTYSDAEAREHARRLDWSLDMLFPALAAAQVGVWRWKVETDASGAFCGALEWDAVMMTLFDVEPGTFRDTYADFADRLLREDREAVEARLRYLVRHDEPYNYRFRVVLRDGSMRWVRGAGMIYRDADGRPTMMTGICIPADAEPMLCPIDNGECPLTMAGDDDAKE